MRIANGAVQCELTSLTSQFYLEFVLGASGYCSVRDTIILANGEPLVQHTTDTLKASGSSQKLPGPSILKNSSKTDLITSQQV